MSNLHPLCLLTRMDTKVSTLYHSFFLVDVIIPNDSESRSTTGPASPTSTVNKTVPTASTSSEAPPRSNVSNGGNIVAEWKLNVVQKISADTLSNLSSIEESLMVFLQHAARNIDVGSMNSENKDFFGTFVITGGDATRYFVTWRGSNDKIFVAVSKFSFPSFTRKVFELLELENIESLPHTLMNLCVLPIAPGCGVRYEIELENGCVPLTFSSNEYVVDEDYNLLAVTFLTPNILLNTWEAIIMERKVLVVSSTPEIIPHVCDILRRLVLPLSYVNTYIPFLTKEFDASIVEAPVPFLIGAETSYILEKGADLSELVIVDLDTRTVRFGAGLSDVHHHNSQHRIGLPHHHIGLPSSMIYQILRDLSNAMAVPIANYASRSCSNANSSPLNAYLSSPVDSVLKIFIDANLSLISARACTLKAFFRIPPVLAGKIKHDYRRYSERRPHLSAGAGFDKKGCLAVGFMKLLRENSFDESIHNYLSCWVEMDDLIFAVYEFADELPLLYLQTNEIETVSPAPIEPENHVFEITVKQQSSRKGTYRFAVVDPESRREWIKFIEDKMKPVHISAAHLGSNKSNLSDRDVVGGGNMSGRLSGVLKTDLYEEQQPIGYYYKEPALTTRNDGSDSGSNTEEQQTLTEFRSNLMKTQMVAYLQEQIDIPNYSRFLSELGHNNTRVLADAIFDPFLETFLWRGENICHIIDNIVHDKVSTNLDSPYRTLFSDQKEKNEQSDDVTIAEPVSTVLTTPATSPVSLSEPTSPVMPKQDSVNIIPNRSKDSGKSKGLFGWIGLSGKKLIDTVKASPASPVNSSPTANYSSNNASNVVDDEGEECNKSLLALLRHISSSYRICESELVKKIIEKRMESVMAVSKALSEPQKEVIPLQLRVSPNLTANSIKKACQGLKKRLSGAIPKPSTSSSWYNKLWDIQSQFNSDEILTLCAQSREDFVHQLTAISDECDGNKSHLKPFISLLLGDLFETLNESEKAIAAYSQSNQLVEMQRVMVLVTKAFLTHIGSDHLSPEYRALPVDTKSIMVKNKLKKFVSWAINHDIAIAFFAYQLIMELSHSKVSAELSVAMFSSNPGSSDSSFSLRSQRMLPAKMRQDLLRGLFDSDLSADITPNFTYTNREGDSGSIQHAALNECVVCTALKQSACELSIQLLSFLRELLRASFIVNSTSQVTNQIFRLTMTQDNNIFDEILLSSGLDHSLTHSLTHSLIYSLTAAFKSFELQSCQLQKVELSTLDVNEKILFFINVYNTLTLHASMRSWPGNGLYDRQAFMRCAKYNIGGHYFSLLDIEHGILRASSSKPMVFGPFTAAMGFKDKDPRKAFSLQVAKPFISFALFSISVSSPALAVLRDIKDIDHELEKLAQSYITEYVRLNVEKKVIYLPEIFRVYWKDFGSKNENIRGEVIKKIYKYSSKKVSSALKALIDSNVRPSISFDVHDWTPQLIL